MAEHADILELGLPFSDPLMDGPVIQEAGAQALAAGFRIGHLFTAARELSRSRSVSLLAMTYWQPVFRYGPVRFAEEFADAGGAGVILPDLPIEEAKGWLGAAQSNGLHTVFVVSPNASDDRLARVCSASSGMVYAPAVAGVSGAAAPLHQGLTSLMERLRRLSHVPIGVGIGVSSAEQARQIRDLSADAVISGSALIRCLAEAPGPAGVRKAVELAEEIAAVLHSSPSFSVPSRLPGHE